MKTVLLLLCIVASSSGQLEGPTFVKDMRGFSMPETTAVGSLLYTLSATDDGVVKYYVDGSVFRVDEVSGEVFLARALDYESGEKELKVNFIATDNDGLTTIVESTINVLDANDNAPKFRKEIYKQEIPEDFTVNTNVISNLIVRDIDFTGQAIEVSCEPNATLKAGNISVSQYLQYVEACETFAPRKLTAGNKEWLGNIVLLQPVDFESRVTYQLPLQTFDGYNRYMQSFEITIQDVNDTPPRFTFIPHTISVQENRPLGTSVGIVEAIDGDFNNPRDIRYDRTTCPPSETTREDASSYFSVHAVTGAISTKAELDRENATFVAGVQICIKAREVVDNRTGELGNDPLTTAVAVIRIDVEDLNDQTPSFDSTSYNTSIYENILDGTAIPGVALTVTDLDGYPANSYDIVLINYKDVYEVFPSNGTGSNVGGVTVKDTTKIDYERGPRQFELYIIARENKIVNGQAPNTGSTTVTIHVLDLNDNTPQFSRPVYIASVRETDRGLEPFIRNIRATDPDSGSMGTIGIEYSLLGSEFERFQIAPTRVGAAAEMRVTSCPTPGHGVCLDYERRKSYEFTVVARDLYGQPGGRQGTAKLVINVIDENDTEPKFILNSHVGSIREGATRTVDPLNVMANDVDTVGEVTYSLSDSPQANYWQIDPRTGLITATEPIYYKFTPGERGWFSLSVIANDSINTAVANVTINVIDLNNFAPTFELPLYSTGILESTLGDVFVIQVKADDMDSGSTGNGRVEYNIERGAQGKFVIDEFNGNISTASNVTFDYDIQQQYELTVLARDGGNPQQTGSTSVTISIIDLNNKAPYFTPAVQIAEISENAPINEWVTTILAKDQDQKANLTYALIEPIEAITPEGVHVDKNVYDYTTLFSLNPSTGVVRVAKNLDRDHTSVITYTMLVKDIADPLSLQTGTRGRLIIRIKEYNDQSPVFQQSVYNLTVEEEQTIGTFIIALVATDVDDAIDLYEIVERDQNLFAITPETGVVTVKSRIDYEEVTRTEFTVRVRDTGTPPRTGEAKLYVNIVNINDNSPLPTQNTYTVRIPEHLPAGSTVLKISATDRDKGDYGVVRYSLPPDMTMFNIDNITGEMTIANGVDLDREKQSVISTRITVYDSPLDETVRRRYSVPVYVSLEDINDNVPIFSLTDYVSAEIIESIDIGARILQVFATDADFGINAKLRYDKVPGTGDSDNLFDVTPFSGQILVARSLRGRIGTYHFNVSASDLNGNPGHLSGYARVTIKVIESLNSAPVWIIPPSNNFTIEVLESQYLGMLVFDVHANDSNSGKNGIVEYFLQDAEREVSNTGEFSINRVTGVIRAEMVYDREAVDRYTLLLVAKDMGERPLRAVRFLNVIIMDVNDNVPEFPMSNGVTIPMDITVWENATVGTVIGSVTATDRDLTEYSKVYYDIIAGDQDKFMIGRESGVITLIDNLDREEQGMYNLEVRASNADNDDSVITLSGRRLPTDSNIVTDPSMVTVRIKVQDINDRAPHFVNFNGPDPNLKEYYGCISTNAAFDWPIVQLSAVDDDEVGSGVIRYNIGAGNTDDAFGVDQLGMVRNKRLLNTVSTRVYIMTASAADERWKNTTSVKVFITESGNEAKLVIKLKPSFVEVFKQQIVRLLHSLDVIRYACVMRVTNHVVGQYVDSDRSDVSLVAVAGTLDGGYRLLSSTELLNIMRVHRSTSRTKYDDLYVESVGGGTGDVGLHRRTPVLAVLILVILLIFLGVILLVLVCFCIKEMEKKRRLSGKGTIAFAYGEDEVDKVNPVYGTVPVGVEASEETDAKEIPITGDVYAVVNKPGKGQPKMVFPQTAEPYPAVGDDDTNPVIETTVVVTDDDMLPQSQPTEVVVTILPENDDDDDDGGPVPTFETTMHPGDAIVTGPVYETVVDDDDEFATGPVYETVVNHGDGSAKGLVLETVVDHGDGSVRGPVFETVVDRGDGSVRGPVFETVVDHGDGSVRGPVFETVVDHGDGSVRGPVFETVVDHGDGSARGAVHEAVVHHSNDFARGPVLETILDSGDGSVRGAVAGAVSGAVSGAGYGTGSGAGSGTGSGTGFGAALDQGNEPARVSVMETVLDSGDESMRERLSWTGLDHGDQSARVSVMGSAIGPGDESVRSYSDNPGEIMDTYFFDTQPEPLPETDPLPELDPEPEPDVEIKTEIKYFSPSTPTVLEPLEEEHSDRDSEHDVSTNPEYDVDVNFDRVDVSPPPSLSVRHSERGDSNSPSSSVNTTPQHTPPPSPEPYIYQGDDDV